MVRVLIADDSPTSRQLLRAILSRERGFDVVGEARDGAAAVRLTSRLRPDVVTMDIRMPGLDGFAATRRIMNETPTPIVIVSGLDVTQVRVSLEALNAGALAVLPKPPGPRSPGFGEVAERFAGTVRAMADVKVVRRWTQAPVERAPEMPVGMGRAEAVTAVGVAASTGGPSALQNLLMPLPHDFGAPIFIVQHIVAGFVGGLATWLDGVGRIRVRVAQEKESVHNGVAYLAPDGCHLGLSDARRIGLAETPPVSGARPSASVLFKAMARVYGAGAVAVVLTGMGEDGLDGARAVRDAGGRVIAQDEATSVVFGMPGAIVRAGLCDEVLPISAIPLRLMELAQSVLGN
jgi:two-component system chemotaxis response regulator CheB